MQKWTRVMYQPNIALGENGGQGAHRALEGGGKGGHGALKK